MKRLSKTLFFVLCLMLLCTAMSNAGFRVVGEARGLYYSVLWDRWFEVPLWVYVESRKLFFLGGGSVDRATAAFPITAHDELLQLFNRGLEELETARDMDGVTVKEVGSVKAVIDSTKNHYNGIDIYLERDRTGQSSDIHVKIYDYMNVQSVTDITLARNQLQDLIMLLNGVPEAMAFLETEDKMRQNINQLDLGQSPESDRLDEINTIRFK